MDFAAESQSSACAGQNERNMPPPRAARAAIKRRLWPYPASLRLRELTGSLGAPPPRLRRWRVDIGVVRTAGAPRDATDRAAKIKNISRKKRLPDGCPISSDPMEPLAGARARVDVAGTRSICESCNVCIRSGMSKPNTI